MLEDVLENVPEQEPGRYPPGKSAVLMLEDVPEDGPTQACPAPRALAFAGEEEGEAEESPGTFRLRCGHGFALSALSALAAASRRIEPSAAANGALVCPHCGDIDAGGGPGAPSRQGRVVGSRSK